MWQLLEWEGKHPQAPVAVAAKTHYFCELDVLRSVQNLLQEDEAFWRSQEFRDSVETGDILGIDYRFFCKVRPFVFCARAANNCKPLTGIEMRRHCIEYW